MHLLAAAAAATVTKADTTTAADTAADTVADTAADTVVVTAADTATTTAAMDQSPLHLLKATRHLQTGTVLQQLTHTEHLLLYPMLMLHQLQLQLLLLRTAVFQHSHLTKHLLHHRHTTHPSRLQVGLLQVVPVTGFLSTSKRILVPRQSLTLSHLSTTFPFCVLSRTKVTGNNLSNLDLISLSHLTTHNLNPIFLNSLITHNLNPVLNPIFLSSLMAHNLNLDLALSLSPNHNHNPKLYTAKPLLTKRTIPLSSVSILTATASQTAP